MCELYLICPLVGGLIRLSRNPEVNPIRLIEYLSQRAGLLVPKGVGVYTFPHRTFQEYLAACYLTDQGYPEQVAELAINDADRWREVILLAAAKAARGSTYAFWALVETLINPEIDKNNILHCWGAYLAGQIIIETADINHLGEREMRRLIEVQNWHQALIASDVFPATERVVAGRNLFILGDARFNSNNFSLPNEPYLGFVEIPKGVFLAGEKGIELELDIYFVARFPTTVDQYRAFIQDSGYKPNRIGLPIKGGGNEPITGITWDDANAYCDWLTEKIRNFEGAPKIIKSFLEEGGYVALPNELEWEKAAKGGTKLPKLDSRNNINPLPNRIFPWGDDPDKNKANTILEKIRSVSPVGCFTNGASPYGVQDMSGNVWEWTRSIFDEVDDGYEYPRAHRVMRGGTFGTGLTSATCNFRIRGNPSHGSRGRGFRVVITKQN